MMKSHDVYAIMIKRMKNEELNREMQGRIYKVERAYFTDNGDVQLYEVTHRGKNCVVVPENAETYGRDYYHKYATSERTRILDDLAKLEERHTELEFRLKGVNEMIEDTKPLDEQYYYIDLYKGYASFVNRFLIFDESGKPHTVMHPHRFEDTNSRVKFTREEVIKEFPQYLELLVEV